jgi:Zn-dependent metalloprotease
MKYKKFNEYKYINKNPQHHLHHLNRNSCFCTYVPPLVLENLAKAGVEEYKKASKSAILSINQSMMTREKRKERKLQNLNENQFMKEFTSDIIVGNAKRTVYDSQSTWNQRVNLSRDEGGKVNTDKKVNIVYDYAAKVRDYYKTLHNRRSIDNADMDLILNIHFGTSYQNAFWDGDEMTFGDGDGDVFVSFVDSLDVVAHELTHGVTQWTANLIYDGQPGALNEHFSDVFGTVITQFTEKQTADTADWLIGDEILGPTLKGEALRSMKAPGSAYDNTLLGKDPQPDHMNNYYSGDEDNHGVHINSGIPNKAFYLTAKDIGTDKAALIWYDALQNLWPTTTFNDAVNVIARSARTLVENDQVPGGSPQTVRAAFKAVGIPT